MFLDMYKGVANSPETTTTNNINETDTIIYVLDETRVPIELPNLMVLGTGVGAETVKVISVNGNAITVERGFQGVPKAWNAGTIIARNFTEYDYNALVENMKNVDTRVGPLASLTTLIKTSIVNAINSLRGEVNEHKAESASKHITESGSNANGSYIKFDDGTMICWHRKIETKSEGWANGDIENITFISPATFISEYVGYVKPFGYTDKVFKDYNLVVTQTTPRAGTLRVIEAPNNLKNVTLQWFAVGRWK